MQLWQYTCQKNALRRSLVVGWIPIIHWQTKNFGRPFAATIGKVKYHNLHHPLIYAIQLILEKLKSSQ